MLGNMIGEPAPVVVREPEALAPKPGSEHTVLLSQVINHILLLAVDPASQIVGKMFPSTNIR